MPPAARRLAADGDFFYVFGEFFEFYCGLGFLQFTRNFFGGGDSGGFGNFLSGRQSANLLTRTTTILATCFITTSLVLAILASRATQAPSILEGTEIINDPIPYESSEEGPQAPIEE